MAFVTIGQIGRAHGVEGCVTVKPLSYNLERFADLSDVRVNDEFFTKLKIESVEHLNNKLRIKFSQFNSREDAEKLRNLELLIDEKEQIDLPKDVFFHHDLVSCSVYDAGGNYIGKVKEVTESTANDLFVVNSDDDREILIPNISEFVKEIDIKNKRIDIQEIPGLLSL